MRRAGLIVLGLLVTGCKVVQDAFSAHPASAAQADGQVLTVERLAELASRVKGMPLEPANLNQLASAYLNYSLFAMSLVKGQTLEDSATVARVMWPILSQLKFEHYTQKRADRSQLSANQVDSAYNAGDVRAFQHILISVPPNATPPVVQQKQTQANTLWRSLAGSGGSNFAAVAKRTSEDPASKPSGGYLDVGGRGRFVSQFEDAAWQLAPGSMSGVVRSSFGFHIIRRPPLAEIRDTFTLGVEHLRAARNDSTYLATLAASRHVAVVSGAGETVRNALDDIDAAGRSDKTLATYTGGRFAMKDFVRWLFAIDPRYAQAVLTANDTEVSSLVQQLVQRSLALQEADSSGVQPTDSEWADVRVQYDSTLVLLQRVLNLNRAVLHDSATTDDGRARLAMARVNDYFDRVIGGQTQFFPIPPLLTQVLRERGAWSVDAAGIQRAAERATALRATADSLHPAGVGNQLTPAPGPPPVAVPDASKRPPAARRPAP